MTRNKLVWKVYPYYLIIIFVSIIVVWLYSSDKIRDTYKENVRTNLLARARLTEDRLGGLISGHDRNAIDSLCTVFGDLTRTRVTVIDMNGLVLGDSERDPETMENHATRPEIIEAYSGNVGVQTRFSNTLQKNMMYVAVPSMHDGATVGVVRTALPVSEIEQAMSSLNTKIALVGLALTLLATMVTFLIFRRISRPLAELKDGADRFARGEFNNPVPVPDTEEIGALAEAMNRMASQLNERILTIIQQRNEQNAVLSSMIEGVVAIDPGERVLNLNEAASRLLGVDQGWARGRLVDEVITNAELRGFAHEALNSGSPVEGEIVLPGDEPRYLRVHGMLLRTAEGNRSGAVMVINDSTRLRKLEGIRRDFVANVSHELKTPITSIRGFVETLIDGALENRADTERFLYIIDKQASRLSAIVEDLLALSRIEKESEREEIELSMQAVRPVLQAGMQACESRVQKREAHLRLECDQSLMARMNARHLEQAVINLIDNAIKYSSPGSTITLSAYKDNDEVVIDVQDEGCGIDAKHLPRLFERFYRVDKARSREVGGTGLGLAIVKHIALAHHGSVHVKSTVGEGSIFSIRLSAK